ncbi:hypothetical protein [Pectobacterium versatile]|uniref:hypothetical protein n=1 Tax=Pectobacterium versatile TaxID=2488639 RepID=UPI0032EB29BD
MKYFRWEFLKRHVGITHLIAFSLGVTVICFLDALVFEKSIADWVSSTANVCMAGAALYAAFHAKDWFSRRISENSFNIANDIIQRIEDLKIKTQPDLWKARQSVHGFRNKSSDSIYNSLDFYISHSNDLENIRSINRKIARIKTLGIIIINENLLNDALSSLVKFYSALLVIYRYQDEIVRETQHIQSDIYEETVNNIHLIFKEVESTSTTLLNTDVNQIFRSKY